MGASMHESCLVSLAILKVNWDVSGKDFIESFVPFVAECVRTSADDAVSLPDLQKQLNLLFGLEIPHNPLRTMLIRAAKRGYLRREHNIFYRNVEKCAATGFRDRQHKVEATYDFVLRKLVEYAKTHSVEWTEEEANNALHGFLRENSLSLLFTIAENSIECGPRTRSGPPFIIGSFITEALAKDRQVVEDIVTLVQGNLLVNALYLPDPSKVQQRFKNTRVYLDTSIISYAAGYAGPICAAPCLELITLLKEHGAELYCFRITIEELHGILDACAERLRKGSFRESFGPSMEYFIETGRTPSDVELMAARLNHKVQSLGISIDDKPPYEKKYQIDEKGFEEALLAEMRYNNRKALIHDVDCISAIARLRRCREVFFPESSWALFVTTNSSLARVTRQFFQRDATPAAVALCMTDYALGNLLWLKSPTKAPDLPRKQLLAHAFAAMQPPDHIWRKYLSEVARLQDQGSISADDYYVLRHSLAAKSALMDLTQDNGIAFSEGAIHEVLAIAKERLRSDLKEAVKKEQESRRTAEELIQKHEEVDAARVATLRQKAAKFAAQVRRAALVVSAAIIFVSTCYTFPWELPRPMDALGRYSLASILLLLLILTFANLMWGVAVCSILDRLQQWTERTLSSWLFRLVGLDQGSSATLDKK